MVLLHILQVAVGEVLQLDEVDALLDVLADEGGELVAALQDCGDLYGALPVVVAEALLEGQLGEGVEGEFDLFELLAGSLLPGGAGLEVGQLELRREGRALLLLDLVRHQVEVDHVAGGHLAEDD